MRTLIWFAYFWGYMIVHLPAMFRGMKALKNGDNAAADAIAYTHVPRWCKKLLKLAGIEVTVVGLENIPADRPCVFAANHRSLYDIPLLLTQLGKPIPLVAKIAEAKGKYVMPLLKKK